MSQTIPDTTTKRAGALQPGDSIAARFLPMGFPAEILHVIPYEQRREPWVMVVYREAGGLPDASYFRAGAAIPVEPTGGAS